MTPNDRAGRWIAAADLAAMFAGSTLLTPLYEIYRDTFRFSEMTLTAIYAVYVVGNLAALLLLGRLSDQIGRKRAALPALAIAALATLVFLFASGPGLLAAGRALSGLAIGLASGAANAWVVDLSAPERRGDATVLAAAANLFGLTAGAVLAGLLAQFAPWPLHLSYVVYLAVLALVAVLVAGTRDPAAPSEAPGKLELRPRLGVPPQIRAQFWPPAATTFASFALLGFYIALAPSILRALRQSGHALAGGLVGGVCLLGSATVVVTKRWRSRTAMRLGLVLLLAGLLLLSLAQAWGSMQTLAAGAAITGIAVALGFRGSLQVVNEIAPEEQRAEVVSSYLVATYLGNALPVLGVGVLSVFIDAQAANYVFAAVIAAIALGALAASFGVQPGRAEERPPRPGRTTA
jgi:MFS family permease